MSRFITVFGATGGQGGGVVRALLEQGTFKVRGITRSVNSKKAKDLAAQGVEMVQASLDDVESCKKAIAGSYGVFLVTDFWSTLDGEKETAQGKAVVDCCVAGGVQHLVYSGLESAQKLYGFKVDHFDSKAKVEEYLSSKTGNMKWTSVRMAAYFNNFLTNTKPTKLPDGTYTINFAMEGKKMYGLDVGDLGGCVTSVFNEPETYGGKILGIASDFLTMEEYCEVFSKVLAPRIFKDPKMTADHFAQLGFPGAAEMAAMFRLYQKGIERDIALTKKLNPKAKNFEEFVTANKSAFESIL